jgi:hypothetical protein
MVVLLKDPGSDPTSVMRDIHQVATAQLVRLMDGFYYNIEDGLFELASRSSDERQRRRCFDLMRELRFRRRSLMNNFARSMDRCQELWFKPRSSRDALHAGSSALESTIMQMAEKSRGHFGGVLQLVAERASQVTGVEFEALQDLPISPDQIARAFVLSCRSLKLDDASISIVVQLFSRFVLDRLGHLYGECNQGLQQLGYLSATELQHFTQQRA